MSKYEEKIAMLKHTIAFIKTQASTPAHEKILRVSEKQLAEMTGAK
jgi:hypothetical protein